MRQLSFPGPCANWQMQMADIVSAEVRSQMMSGIRSKHTKPELLIRRELHKRGFRFRLHDRRLPGKPDIIFPRYRAVIFVHGCFWHGHNCHLFKMPSSRTEFWQTKIQRNKELDTIAQMALTNLDWRQGIVWECALKGKTKIPLDDVILRCAVWLHNKSPALEIGGR